MNSILSLVALVLAVQFVSACFITNCPPGGKRSIANKPANLKRACQKCGPTGFEGQCYGPNICCGDKFGCQIGNAVSRVCQMENLSTRPCEVQGKRCGPSANGVCAIGTICCEPDRCYEDKSCLPEQIKFSDSPLFAKSPFKMPFNDKARAYHLTPENLENINQESELSKLLSDLFEKSEV